MTTGINTARVAAPQWTLGDRIRKARTTKGMDQREFAAALGMKAGTLAGWETDRQTPRNIVEVAKSIEAITGIDAAWVLGVSSLTHEYLTDKSGRSVVSSPRSAPRSMSLIQSRRRFPRAAQ